MRLTLRTLLAYLDDILEPGETREIGKKIQEAPVAQELVTRIRDVVRRRRLMAPTLDGPESGVDPNVVAEYLDNQLTPPQVTQTERILLNSEMHLAEVASAHQILTLVLGEPVEVLPESRSRMYALGPVGDDEKLVVESAAVATPTIEPSDKLAVSSSSQANPNTSTDTGVSLTNYVNERTRKRKWWPLVGVGLLGCLFVALQLTDPGKSGEPGSAARGIQATVPVEPDNAPAAEVVAATPPAADSQVEPSATEQDLPAGAISPDEPVVASTEPNVDSDTIDLPPPADAPAAAGDMPPTDGSVGTAITAAEPPATDPTEPADTTSVATGVEPQSTPDVTFVAPPAADADAMDVPEEPGPPKVITIPDSIAGDKPAANDVTTKPVAGPPLRLTQVPAADILLRQTEVGWKVVRTSDLLIDGQGLASPKPYVARFVVDKMPCTLYLCAGSRMTTYATPNANMGLQLDRGHIVLARMKEDAAVIPEDDENVPARTVEPGNMTEPVSVELRVSDRTWLVTLPAGECRIAFDATPVPPVRLDKPFDGFPFKVFAVGSVGSVTVKPADAEAKTIGSEDRIALAGPTPGAVLVEPGGATNWLVSKDPVQTWVDGPVAPTDRRDAIRFAKEFDPIDPIVDSMPSLLRHERSFMARRAAQCLALTGNYESLVRSISIATHDEATSEAIQGLREWLPSDPQNGAMLKASLEQEFTDEQGLAVYQLLWGYDEGNARNPKISRQLVRWLSDRHPAVQRLAYFHIVRLTGGQDDYKSNLSQDRLSSFQKRWERQILKHGTLLSESK